jgi:hypothetical protein
MKRLIKKSKDSMKFTNDIWQSIDGSNNSISTSSEKFNVEEVLSDPSAVKHIINPSEEVLRDAFLTNEDVVKYLLNQSVDFLGSILGLRPSAINIIAKENADLAVDLILNQQIEPFIRDRMLFHVEWSSNVQFEDKLVEKNPHMIRWLRNPTEKAQLIAVNSRPNLIKEIKNPSWRAQARAVQIDSSAIWHIENPENSIQMLAVSDDPYNIKFIKKPTETVQMDALKRNPMTFGDIKNPCQKARDFYQKYHEEHFEKKNKDKKEASVKKRIKKKSDNQVGFQNKIWDEIGKGQGIAISEEDALKKIMTTHWRNQGEAVKEILSTGFVPSDDFLCNLADRGRQFADIVENFCRSNNIIPSDKLISKTLVGQWIDNIFKLAIEKGHIPNDDLIFEAAKYDYKNVELVVNKGIHISDELLEKLDDHNPMLKRMVVSPKTAK